MEEKFRDVYEISNTLNQYPDSKEAFDAKIAVLNAAKIKNSLEAKKVIERYLEAIGGKDNVASVKTVFSRGRTFGESFLLVNEIIEDKKMSPNKYTSSLYFRPRKKKSELISTVVFNGESGYKQNKTSKIPLTETEILTFKENAIFPELNYLSLPYKFYIVDTLNLASGKAYKLKIESPAGKVQFRYYNMSDNLLYKIEDNSDTSNTTSNIILSDYREINGIKMPYKKIQGDQEAIDKKQNIKQATTIFWYIKNRKSKAAISIMSKQASTNEIKTTIWFEIKINEEVTENDFKLE